MSHIHFIFLLIGLMHPHRKKRTSGVCCARPNNNKRVGSTHFLRIKRPSLPTAMRPAIGLLANAKICIIILRHKPSKRIDKPICFSEKRVPTLPE